MSKGYQLQIGNILLVDAVNGNDATASVSGSSFLTVDAAIAAATSGQEIHVMPGTYNLSAGITMPSGVSLRGADTGTVFIQMLSVVADTTLVTMGTNTRIEDVTLKLTSSEHHTLKGVVFPGTTTSSAKLRTLVLTVDNSGASDAGTSNVYGVHVAATSTPGRQVSAIRAVTVSVASAGLGNKRGILADTSACNFYTRDVNTIVTRTGSGAGSYIGVETNFAGIMLAYDAGSIEGFSADVSQTLGSIELGPVNLINANANALAFTPTVISTAYVFADAGGLPSNATRFMRPGTDPVAASEIFIRVPKKTVILGISIRAISGPGGALVDTWTVRKNGADTGLAVSLTGAATLNENSAVSVSFAEGDSLSVKVVTAVATGTSDCVITVDVY